MQARVRRRSARFCASAATMLQKLKLLLLLSCCFLAQDAGEAKRGSTICTLWLLLCVV